jgi:hypothetical protein
VRDGISKQAPAQPSADGEGASATIVTLEQTELVLLLDAGGVRADPSCSANAPSTVYDSISSFLLNNSPGYRTHFYSSLTAQLELVAQQRAAEEAEEET